MVARGAPVTHRRNGERWQALKNGRGAAGEVLARLAGSEQDALCCLLDEMHTLTGNTARFRMMLLDIQTRPDQINLFGT
jgi:hypothetical protein